METSLFSSIQMAVPSNFFQVFMLLGMYNFDHSAVYLIYIFHVFCESSCRAHLKKPWLA